jgi:hypothetical protein
MRRQSNKLGAWPRPTAPPPIQWAAFVAIVLLSAVSSSARDAQPQTGWNTFTSETGGFTVQMPARPEKYESLLEDPRGRWFVQTKWEHSTKDAPTFYRIIVQDLPTTPLSLKRIALKPFEEMTDTEKKDAEGYGIKVIDIGRRIREAQITLADHKGLEQIRKMPDGTLLMVRSYLVEQRLYVIGAKILDNEVSRRNATYYFNSFKFQKQPSQWISFSPPGGRFTIQMPGQPDSTRELLDTPNGKVNIDRFTYYSGTEVAYSISVVDQPQSGGRQASQNSLEAARDALIARLNGRLRSDRVGSASGVAWREIEFEAPSGVSDTPDGVAMGRARFLSVGSGRRYTVLAYTLNPAAHGADVRRFVESFQLQTDTAAWDVALVVQPHGRVALYDNGNLESKGKVCSQFLVMVASLHGNGASL